jgi:hypothetical protein
MLDGLVGKVEENKLWLKKLLDVLVEFFSLSYLLCTNNLSSLIP